MTDSPLALPSDERPTLKTIAAATGLVRKPRPHAASEEELARHAGFIAKIRDALWGTGSATAH